MKYTAHEMEIVEFQKNEFIVTSDGTGTGVGDGDGKGENDS